MLVPKMVVRGQCPSAVTRAVVTRNPRPRPRPTWRTTTQGWESPPRAGLGRHSASAQAGTICKGNNGKRKRNREQETQKGGDDVWILEHAERGKTAG